MNDFYVYAWLRPDGTPFYIGKGRGRRCFQAKAPGNVLFIRTVEKIRRTGQEPRVVKWQEGLTEGDAFALEAAYIKLFGRRDNGTGVLANLTDGGEGTVGCFPSQETISKLSEGHKRQWRRPGAKERLSAALRVKWEDEEFRAKQNISRSAANALPDVKARRSEAVKKSCAKPEVRRRRSEASLEVASRPGMKETYARNSALARKMEGPRGKPYKGVVPTGNGRAWLARIKVSKVNYTYGPFDDQAQAARAYDEAAVSAWGYGNCYLNFPDDYKLEAAE